MAGLFLFNLISFNFEDLEFELPARRFCLDHIPTAENDDPAYAWDYDLLREQIEALASERRYNLQESLAHRIYDRVASMRGVAALRVALAKPDVYPNARGVGVEISSRDEGRHG